MNEDVINQVVSNVLRRVAATASEPKPTAIETSESSHEYFAPWTGEAFSTVSPAHPSQEQFNIGEASEKASAVHEFIEFLEAQRCTIEKNKSCDHCGACRMLGF